MGEGIPSAASWFIAKVSYCPTIGTRLANNTHLHLDVNITRRDAHRLIMGGRDMESKLAEVTADAKDLSDKLNKAYAALGEIQDAILCPKDDCPTTMLEIQAILDAHNQS
jgi:hypothetical protein